MLSLPPRILALETVRALCVLALIFLGFAHAPAAAATFNGDGFAAITDSWCGDAPESGKTHTPCHACRIGGGADLPPVPDFAVPFRVARAVTPAVRQLVAHGETTRGVLGARGPPRLS